MLIEPDCRLSIRRQCDLIGLPPSSYYYTPVGENPYNLELMGLMDQRFTDKPFLGVGQMHTWLQRSGHHVNIKRISRLWKLMGLRTLSPNHIPVSLTSSTRSIRTCWPICTSITLVMSGAATSPIFACIGDLCI